jgi:hypothetical protein
MQVPGEPSRGEMRFMKDNRPPTFGNATRQRRNPSADAWGRRWRWFAFLSAVLTVAACEFITPLDYGGNSSQPNTSGGPDSGTDGATPGNECNNGCSNDRICVEGTCLCAAGQIECNGTCIDSLADAGYCGTCGTTCRVDQICSDGGCACRQSETQCGTSCVDLTADSQHCGACDNSCQSGQTCVGGTCKVSPCDGLCTNPEMISATSDGFRMEPLGQTERCIAIEGYIPTQTNPRIVCWNIDTTTRSLKVDGQSVSCLTGNGFALSQLSAGWYCIQVAAGGDSSAGLLLPTI